MDNYNMEPASFVLDSGMDFDLKFRVTEAYKVVRTNIAFSLLKEGCKKVVISSSLSGEGKTTTAVNIAVSLAQMDVKVLLLDADLRNPQVNLFFNLGNTPGLTDYLGNMSEISEIIHTTQYNNLSVICAGIAVPNPSELLASSRMADLLKMMENRFDYIVMDTPPLNVVVDALPLIKLSDGVILVVREGSCTYPELNRTIKGLEMVDAKILGFILNDSKVRQKSGYRYRYKKPESDEKSTGGI
jgi:capsular exopolysaccharide synthesis family protein